MCGFLIYPVFTIILLFLIYWITKLKFNYWKKKNVPHPKALPLFGNYINYIFQQQYIGEVEKNLCKEFPNEPYFGSYYGTEPVLIAQDPDILKLILTKDFYYFNGRQISKYEKCELITQNLFFSSGNRWHTVRTNLTPLFTSAKMKNMFYLIEKCSYELEDLIDTECKISGVLDARDLMTRYTMDCICSCAFGIDANTMKNGANNPFKQMSGHLFMTSTYDAFKMIFRSIWPAIFYGLKLKYFPSVANMFFSQMLKEVFQSRNYEPSPRNDFVDQVLSFKKQEYLTSDCISNSKTGDSKKVQLKLDDELLVAQCIVFFGAGFETSATISSFTLYELAKNPEAQRKAIEEVDAYLRRHGNKLNYDCVSELPYLEACAYEAMRLYPILGSLTREVMDEYTFPTGLRLEKGVRVHIPVYSIHHNPDNFPDPEAFKPERFLPENKINVKPYTFFPYGGGQRTCIGKRFSKMQMLAGLVTVLKKYRMELADGMPETLPLETKSFLMQPKTKGLFLKFIERDGWEGRVLTKT